MHLLSTGIKQGIAKTQSNPHHFRTPNRQLNVKMSTKKGVFSESLAISFSCPYFPHHGEETQALQPLQSNPGPAGQAGEETRET